MEITQDGKTYRFKKYADAMAGDTYLSSNGMLYHALYSGGTQLAIFEEVKSEVTIGHIVWEVGERRAPKQGEWYLIGKHELFIARTNYARPDTILTPVRIAHE